MEITMRVLKYVLDIIRIDSEIDKLAYNIRYLTVKGCVLDPEDIDAQLESITKKKAGLESKRDKDFAILIKKYGYDNIKPIYDLFVDAYRYGYEYGEHSGYFSI